MSFYMIMKKANQCKGGGAISVRESCSGQTGVWGWPIDMTRKRGFKKYQMIEKDEKKDLRLGHYFYCVLNRVVFKPTKHMWQQWTCIDTLQNIHFVKFLVIYIKIHVTLSLFLTHPNQRIYWVRVLRFSQWREKRKWAWKADRRGAEDDHIR